MTSELSSRQQLFVIEYTKDFNGKRAATAAGYAAHTAEVTASKMLRIPKIASALAQAKAERIERVEVDAAEVLRLLHIQVTADPADIYDSDGKLLPISQWPEGWRLLLTSLDVAVDGTVKARFSDRARLISLMGKHCDVGAYEKRIVVDTDDSLVEMLEAGARRVKEMRVALNLDD